MAGVYERKDHLYQQAKEEGYRSRAAYKLMEIDKKFGILKPGQVVLDLGCFPGGWVQVVSKKVGRNGLVIGIDLDDVEPFPQNKPESSRESRIEILKGDICDPEMQQKISQLAGGKVHTVLSDMSPKLTGIRFRDIARSSELVEMGAWVASQMLLPGGSFVAKTFPGNESDVIFQSVRKTYKQFSRHVLKSSRKTSTEYYFVGRGFSGVE